MTDIPEPKFVPGEVVVILQSRLFPEEVGRKTTILKIHRVPGWAGEKELRESWAYKTHHNIDSKRFSWQESQLGKLPPNEKISFENCVWQPKKETA